MTQAAALAASMMVMASGCVDRTAPGVEGTTASKTSTSPGAGPGGGTPAGEPAGNLAELKSISGLQVGIKTAEQISMAMSELTGIPPTSGNIRNAMNELKPQLPGSYDLASFQPSNQIAITKLATEYCDLMFENQALRDALQLGVNFTQNPAQAYASVAVREGMIAKLMARFWGTGLERLPDPVAAKAELLALLTTLTTNPTNSATGTRGIAKGVCTAVLASSPVTLL